MTTDILSLTELTENQASKYLTHNEALRQIEAMLVRVLSRTNGGAPASPSAGDVYIVDDASGDWSGGSVNDIAHYYSGAWHFYTPIEGLSIWCVDEAIRIYYTGTAWSQYVLISEPNDLNENSSTTTGLTWGYTSGKIRNDSAVVSVSAGTVSLTDDATNYVEASPSGIISVNTTEFTSGSLPLREVVTSSGSQTSSTDKRSWLVINNAIEDIADSTMHVLKLEDGVLKTVEV